MKTDLLLRLGNVLILILTPILLVSALYNSLLIMTRTYNNDGIGGVVCFYLLFGSTFWLALRLNKAISRTANLSEFKKLSYTGYIGLIFLMTVFYIVWVLVNFFYLGGNSEWFVLLGSFLLGVYPFQLLGLIFFVRRHQLYTKNWF